MRVCALYILYGFGSSGFTLATRQESASVSQDSSLVSLTTEYFPKLCQNMIDILTGQSLPDLS